MNFLQIVQRVHRESGRSTPAPTTVATTDVRQMRVVDAVKDAWREFQSERPDWKWMRQTLDSTLVVDQQTYDATADFGAARFGRWRAETEQYWPIVYVDGSPNAQWPLSYTQLDLFRQRWIYRVMGGTLPLDWAIDEQQRLLVGPKPGLAYKLRIDFWQEPYELGTQATDPNDDVPDMPERFHNALVWRALIDVATFDAKQEILSLANVKFTDLHDKLVRDQALELPYV